MIGALALFAQTPQREFQLANPQIVVGLVATVVCILCILFHYEVMSFTSRLLPRISLNRRPRIVALILMLLGAHVVEVWIFGLTYWLLSGYPSLGELSGPFDEGALDYIYYSVTVFTTLGFGDIVPRGAIRILTGSEALLGLGMITWSASLAFLEMQKDWGEFRHPELTARKPEDDAPNT